MIAGLGFDMCAAVRFEQLKSQEGFLRRIFSPTELALSRERGLKEAEALAGRWAAKESLAKALQRGLFSFKLTEAEALSLPNGSPAWFFSGDLQRQLGTMGISAAWLSLSYERGMAAAITLLEKKE